MRSTLVQRLPQGLLIAAMLILPALLLGLPLGAGQLRAAPEGEVARHLWALEQARSVGALSGSSELLDHPAGGTWQLIDPGSLPVYALGEALGGPAAGWNLLLWLGLVVAAAGGWLLARESGADRWGQALGLAVGVSAPGLLQVALDGMTEGLGVGFVALQLGALVGLLRKPRRWLIVPLALGIAGASWMGPYNAVWVALIDIPLGILLLTRRRWEHLLGGALGVALSVPPLALALGQDAASPGGEQRGGVGRLLLAEGQWRGAQRAGADLLDLLTPEPLLQAASALPATAYIGVVVAVVALVGLARAPRQWPWMLGAVLASALALGPHIAVAGEPVELAGPAAWLGLLGPLDRLSRWYRVGALVPILLIPLVVRSWPGRGAGLLALLVLLDARFLAPFPSSWPQVSVPSAELGELDGPIVPLPEDQSSPQLGQLSDGPLLNQLVHGQPALVQLTPAPRDSSLSHAISQLEEPKTMAGGVQMFAERDFAYLELQSDRASTAQSERVEELLGPPVLVDGSSRYYRLKR